MEYEVKQLADGGLMDVQTYRSHSAMARCYQWENGLWQADYTGPLRIENALLLGRYVSEHTRQAKCTIERTDGALLLFNDVAKVEQIDYLVGSPPGCIICTDESFQQVQAFSRLLARLGVIRVVFRTDEMADALEFSAALLNA